MQQAQAVEEASALLARLAQKPGVQSTLILSRDTGTIVRASGLVSSTDDEGTEGAVVPSNAIYTNGEDVEAKKRAQSAEGVARTVWNFMKSAGNMVDELNGGDAVKLLRVRTRKNELVIVPDSKFLLVVIHDTPSA